MLRVLLAVLLSFATLASARASTWTEATTTVRTGTQEMIGATSSSDGTKLAATVWNGYIWTSSDSGETWTPTGSTQEWTGNTQEWRGVTSSSDGTKLAAVTTGPTHGYIYVSTDSGATWTTRSDAQSWFGIASSSDGTKLAACASGGHIYLSLIHI